MYSPIPNFCQMSRKWDDGNGFVNPSTNWHLVGMWWTFKTSDLTNFLTKWKQIAICFILEWKTGFRDRCFARRLSVQTYDDPISKHPISCRKFLIHTILKETSARTRNSASVDDLATIGCFLANQETKLFPKYIANPSVLLQSSIQPAQSASV